MYVLNRKSETMILSKENIIFKLPKSFYTLFFTEFWERFSYYGMKAILLFYIYYSVSDGGLGFSKSTAASIVAIYGALIYGSGLFGGYIGDRFFDPYKTVLYGGVLIMSGHITLSALSQKEGLFLGLFLIIIGSGLLKPNVSNLIGKSYGNKENLREPIFLLFYIAAMIGAFVSPLLTGWLGLKYNFHYGFGLAAIGMFIGIVIFYFTDKELFQKKSSESTDKIKNNEFKPIVLKSIIVIAIIIIILFLMNLFNLLNIDNIISLISICLSLIPIYMFYLILSSKKVTKKEHSNFLMFIPLFLISIVFWILFWQIGLSWLLFANIHVELYWVPISWLVSLTPLFFILMGPILTYLWIKLKDKQPSTPKKVFIGLIIASITFLTLTIPALSIGNGAKVTVLWIVLASFLISIAELLISPTITSATYKLAPKFFKSRAMALDNLSNCIGLTINSQIMRFFPSNEANFFIILAILPLISATIFYFYIKKIEVALR